MENNSHRETIPRENMGRLDGNLRATDDMLRENGPHLFHLAYVGPTLSSQRSAAGIDLDKVFQMDVSLHN